MRFPLVSISLFALVTAAALAAETGADPAARAKAIAPFLDETTIAVICVDVARMPAEAVAGKLASLVPELGPDVNKVLEPAKTMQTAFAQAGGRELYVVVSLADLFTDPWFVVVPLADGANAGALSELMGPACEARQKTGGALVGGRKATLQRLSQLQPDPRPELETAFAAAGDAAIVAVLLPPKYSDRVIEEMMPTLPKEIGGGPSRTLTQGVRWAALSVEAVPQISARLVVQSQDAQAAQALRDKWIELLGLVANNEAVRRELPPLAAATEILKPDVQQERLVIRFDEQHASGPNVLDAIRLSIREARNPTGRGTTKEKPTPGN